MASELPGMFDERMFATRDTRGVLKELALRLRTDQPTVARSLLRAAGEAKRKLAPSIEQVARGSARPGQRGQQGGRR